MYTRRWWDNDLVGIGVVVLGVIGFIMLIGAIAARIDAVGDQAEIEQLRADIQTVGCIASEDVFGQATQWNQKIASKKSYNRRWWAAWIIPNSWDAVAPLSAGRCQSS